MYDVIIAGAGIGGPTAAYFLSRQGLKVLVVEKKKLPRYKPCGGAVPVAVLSLFPFSLEPVVEQRITTVTYCFQGQKSLTVPFPSSVVMVMRDKLDYFVLEQAGVEVWENQRITEVRENRKSVTVLTERGDKIHGRYLIAADGANSVVARSLGLRRKKALGIALEVEIPANDDLLDTYNSRACFFFGTVKSGYEWIFPKKENLSVGIGTLDRTGENLKALLIKDMARQGLPLDGLPLKAHPLPVYRGRQLLHTQRTMLIGDAAGLMDPVSGEGIRYAVHSARIAAEAILNENINTYTRRVQREIGAHLSKARLWAWAFYHHPHASFELGVRNPYLTPDFARMYEGRLSYGGMLLRIPLYLGGVVQRLECEERIFEQQPQEAEPDDKETFVTDTRVLR